MSELKYRYKAWIIFEAETPLSVGSGETGLTTDRLVATNAAGIPFIPGTGLTGSLRASLSESINEGDIENIFGSKGQGSRLIINSAYLIGDDGLTALDGLKQVEENSIYYKTSNTLPVRDHARINERGATFEHGKFDEQVCYKGTRFATSIELLGTSSDNGVWEKIMSEFKSPLFRIGGGTRKGFGKFIVLSFKEKIYNLENPKDLNSYLEDDNSLQATDDATEFSPKLVESSNYLTYEFHLTPRDFFYFGAGYGDEEADDIYKTEKVIEWTNHQPVLSQKKILIPATSIKGAIRHRLAYHYNKKMKSWAENKADPESDINLQRQIDELEKIAQVPTDIASDDGWWEQTIANLDSKEFKLQARKEKDMDATSQNKAVQALFGYATEHTDNGQTIGQKGKVIFDDIFLDPARERVFDHVRIDRYTGGASEGALFQEKTVEDVNEFSFKIIVAGEALSDKNIKEAWHSSLSDLCEGRLPLGGKTTKGHGFFKGRYEIIK